MGLAVTATGNHFLVDSLAGSGLAAATLLAIHLYRRRVPAHRLRGARAALPLAAVSSSRRWISDR
jgi:hypothetical protein